MMRTIIKYFFILTGFVFLFFVGVGVFKYYDIIFAKTVHGQIFEIQRVNQPNVVVGSASAGFNPELMHSYAVAIRTLQGEIFTASGYDRQWEVVRKGICVEAKFYPYPPWEFEKGGTYKNARLIKMKQCTPDYETLGKLPEGSTASEGNTPAAPTAVPVEQQPVTAPTSSPQPKQ